MTTARSPLRKLKAQADQMAELLKKAERGEAPAIPFASKILEARSRPSIKFAVLMDDKALSIEMPWKTIAETSQAGISEYILKQMREARDNG